jgi:hypothetical protein
MNIEENETKPQSPERPKSAKRRHPYMMSNSAEETIRRMRSFPERAAKFLEKFNADREKNSR